MLDYAAGMAVGSPTTASFRRGGVVFFVLALASVVLIPVVRADSQDDQFLQLLKHDIGLTGNSTQLIKAGRDVCKVLASADHTSMDVLVAVVLADVPSLDSITAAGVVGDATSAYCDPLYNRIS
jgi:hypothetical protein